MKKKLRIELNRIQTNRIVHSSEITNRDAQVGTSWVAMRICAYATTQTGQDMAYAHSDEPPPDTHGHDKAALGIGTENDPSKNNKGRLARTRRISPRDLGQAGPFPRELQRFSGLAQTGNGNDQQSTYKMLILRYALGCQYPTKFFLSARELLL